MRNYLRKIFVLVDRKLSQLSVFLIVFLLASLMDVVGLALVGPFIDLVVNQENATIISLFPEEYHQDIPGIIFIFGVALLAVFLFKSIYSLWSNWLLINFTQKVQVDLRVSLASNILARSMQELEDTESSEILQNVHTLTNSFALQTVYPLLKIVADTVIVVAIFVFLILQDSLAVVLLVIIFGSFLVGYDRWCRAALKQTGEAANQSSEDLLAFITDIFNGYKEIKILNKREAFLKRIKDKSNYYAINFAKYFMLSTVPRYLLEFIVVFFMVAYVLVSIELGTDFDQIVRVTAIFGVAAVRLLPIGSSLLNSFVQLRYSVDAVERLSKAFEVTVFSGKNKGEDYLRARASDKTLCLSITDGLYKYPKNDFPTLTNINMKVKEGSCVGIIGDSGSGKSTLLSLMMGIRKLDSGEITSGGYPVNELATAWQSRISYLPQDTFLFAGTLLQNICFDPGSLPVDREKVKNALKVAEFLPRNTSWDDFIDSRVSGGGANLSGGQRQRVAFARAIYHDRDVMFMDEITSALDFESEVELLNQLTLMKGHRTIIIISHSKNVLDVCDDVYEVKQGTIAKV